MRAPLGFPKTPPWMQGKKDSTEPLTDTEARAFSIAARESASEEAQQTHVAACHKGFFQASESVNPSVHS